MTSMLKGEQAAAAESENLGLVQGTDGAPDRPLAGGPTSHPEEAGLLLTPAFSRMRTDWNSADWKIVDSMHKAVDQMVQEHYGDLLEIILDLYDTVREVEVGPGGVVKYDDDGLPSYKRTPSGGYAEDWARLTRREMESALFRISVNLFRWEQHAERLRAEALIGKAQFEEAFSRGYEEIQDDKATIDARTARGRIRSAEYRYRAVYLSYLSRRSDAAVRSIERLGQRLKDVLTGT